MLPLARRNPTRAGKNNFANGTVPSILAEIAVKGS